MDIQPFLVERLGTEPERVICSMSRILVIIACIAASVVTASTASAQWVQTLRSSSEAKAYCRYSEPREAMAANRPSGEALEPTDGGEQAEGATPETTDGYQDARRLRARRPVAVWFDAAAAPVIDYDRLSGRLRINAYAPVPFANGYAVKVALGTLSFALPEEKAQLLWARYEAGTARVKLTFFPAAWAEYQRPLCRDKDGAHVLDGEVLRAEIVDEVGQELALMETELGREVAMMQEHRIRGYLDSGVPVVTVSSLTRFPANGTTLDEAAVGSVNRAIRTMLYGCYLRGLAKNARLQGALVVNLTFEGDARAGVLVDSLHDTATTACALEKLGELARQDRTFKAGTNVKATMIFRLEEAPNL